MAVILINVFIALLSTTFERVHDASHKLFLLERAKKIVKIEQTYCSKTLLNKLKKTPTRYICKYKNRDISMNTDEKIDKLEQSLMSYIDRKCVCASKKSDQDDKKNESRKNKKLNFNFLFDFCSKENGQTDVFMATDENKKNRIEKGLIFKEPVTDKKSTESNKDQNSHKYVQVDFSLKNLQGILLLNLFFFY